MIPKDAQLLINKGLATNPLDPQLTMYAAIAEYKLGNKKIALDLATRLYASYPNEQTQYLLNQISNNAPVEVK